MPVNATVLLIDAAQLERKINEWTLAHAGYEVISASSGEEGLRLVRDKTPDVIVLDPLLADVRGRSLLTELKRNSLTARIPVIILSPAGGAEVERLKREGAAEVLEKEKQLSDNGLLLDTVEGVLHPVL